jgi:hypothetical protein
MSKKRKGREPPAQPLTGLEGMEAPIFEAPIPGLQEKIWRRSKVHQLPEGISLVGDGRSGHLYERRGDRFIDIYLELAGDPSLDIVVFLPETLHWVHVDSFERVPLSAAERQTQVERFRAYLNARGLRYSL